MAPTSVAATVELAAQILDLGKAPVNAKAGQSRVEPEALGQRYWQNGNMNCFCCCCWWWWWRWWCCLFLATFKGSGVQTLWLFIPSSFFQKQLFRKMGKTGNMGGNGGGTGEDGGKRKKWGKLGNHHRAGSPSGGFTTHLRLQGEKRALAAASSSSRHKIFFWDTVAQNRHVSSSKRPRS